ncbi:hypothetical protein C6503_06580 [Candidatus Poribacteria bacterium]|nr:MAG: hypothetical protein C6503_06580 [Candidatus Poribacteria bacterium]
MELKKDISAAAHDPQPPLSVSTLTLMFTDIEGSTLLWEAHGNEVMAEVIQTHNTILRAANSAWGGTEILSEGDAFLFVFSRASAAVMCALEIQLVLDAYQWHESIEALRVRIGIHTGDMILLDDEYHGMPANLAKRITDAGHGGQILLSAVTHELVRTQFPYESFVSLGEHRLKNIQHPETIFQFVGPRASILRIIGEERWREVFGKGTQENSAQDRISTDTSPIPQLQTEFPPLRTINDLPNNLPAPINSFIGREVEVRRIVGYFTDGQTRLVTLTGPGGIGKTRLALQVATELHNTYADGVWFIALADLRQSTHIITEIAKALVLPLKSTQDVMEQVVSYLLGKTLLLVLDNFEHVMEASEDVKTLLLKCPTLHCLTTSREPLKIAGEQRFIVPPLSVPPENIDCEALRHYESVQLFLARAETVAPGFQLTADNAETIGAICRAVDGLSLAIELAASRVRAMTPQHILARLKVLLDSSSPSKSSTFLSTSDRDVPARHQTLNAVIDWSYELLEPEEQLLLCQLSLFSGGFFLEAAEAVCSSTATQSETETIELIFNLHDKSLLMIEENLMQTRYRLPAPLQLYLREKQPATAFREAHAHYYLTLAQEQDRKLEGSEQSEALSEMAIELDNFRAVFRFAQENAKWHLFGQLAVALSEFFYVRGLWNDGLEWLKQAEIELNQQVNEGQELKDASETDEMSLHLMTIAELQVALAKIYNEQQERETARRLCENALQIFRTLGQQLGIVKALNRLGIIARYEEKLEEADIRFTEALAIAKVLGNKWHIAFTLNNLGLTAYHRRHFEEARLRYTESLHLAREIGDKQSIAYTLNNLGKTVQQQGLREEAKHYYTESLRLTRGLSTSSTGIPYLLDSFGKEALRRGSYEEARHYYTESLEYRKENSSPREIADSLYQFGQLARAEAKFEQSLCLFLRVASIYAETGSTTPFYVDAVNKDIAALEAKLDNERVEELKLEMETRTLQEIVNICLSH